MRFVRLPLCSFCSFLQGASGCAHRRAISGQVIDRNGQPMDRVLIRLDPGNVRSSPILRVSIASTTFGMTEATGFPLIGNEYRIEAFRLGFHIQ